MLTGEEHLRAYRPRIPDEKWRIIGPIVREMVRRAGYVDRPYVREALQSLTHLASWALDVGIDLSVETLLSPATVERYIATGTPTLSPATRGTRRSTLSTLGRLLTVTAPWLPKRSTYPLTPASVPYTRPQIRQLLIVAGQQATPVRRRAATAIIGLGLGAGLRPREVRTARGRDIRPHDVTGAIITISGEPARSVPFLTPLAGAVNTLARAHPGLVVRDTPMPVSHMLADIIEALEMPASLRPLSVSRLRATWATILLKTVPLPTVMRAYGASSVNSLRSFVPSLTAGNTVDTQAIAMLAAGLDE